VDIEVYSIESRLIEKSKSIKSIELNKGFYLVKIYKDKVSVTTKVIVR